MTEIVLDVPNAYHILSKFVERCLATGFLSSNLAKEIPQRLAGKRGKEGLAVLQFPSVGGGGGGRREGVVCVVVVGRGWNMLVIFQYICTYKN